MTKKKKDIKEPKQETEEIPEIKVSDLINENLQKATKDAQEYKDKYYRSLAENENTRKRLQQEKEEMIAYAIDNMLSEFLSPLDNLDNALSFTDNLSEELKNWAQGFKMISSQFKTVLENHGVIPFDSMGKQFDPHYHEALEVVETDEHENNTIVSEIEKGYLHGKRILRVAKVKVAKQTTKAQPNKDQDIKGEK